MQAHEIVLLVLGILLAVGAVVAVALIIAKITYNMAFYKDRRHDTEPIFSLEDSGFAPYADITRASIESLQARSYERVEITSCDGLRLVARYYHINDGAPVDILFHGYKSLSYWDFANGIELAFAMGHNVLLVDQRAHGDSEGHTISFGVMERYDVLSWCRWADEHFNTKLYIWGVSMGAASVLMALDLPLPKSVIGVVADCPYTSPKDIIVKVAHDRHLPGMLLFPLVRLGARIFGGFKIGRASADKAVVNAKVPVLLIHGEADGFVPFSMSRRIETAAKGAGVDMEFYAYPGADHALSFLSDPERYKRELFAFSERCLKMSAVENSEKPQSEGAAENIETE